MQHNNNFDVFHADEIYSDHMKDLAKIEKQINGEWHVIWEKRKGIDVFESTGFNGTQLLRKGLWEFKIVGAGGGGNVYAELFWGIWRGSSAGGGSGAACTGTFKVRRYDDFRIVVGSSGTSTVSSAKNGINIVIDKGGSGECYGDYAIGGEGGTQADSTIELGKEGDGTFTFYPGHSGATHVGTTPPDLDTDVFGGNYANGTLPYGGGHAGGAGASSSWLNTGKASTYTTSGYVYLRRIGGLS